MVLTSLVAVGWAGYGFAHWLACVQHNSREYRTRDYRHPHYRTVPPLVVIMVAASWAWFAALGAARLMELP